jgi:tetratricopeptide (TPR) repeat protein
MDLGDLIGWCILLPLLGIWGFRSLIKSDDRRTLVVKWVFSAIFILIIFYIAWLHNPLLSLLYCIPAVLLAFLWVPSIGRFLLKPLTDAFDGGTNEVEAKPFFFIAEAKRRKGLYQEAVAEMRRQLEQFPGNVEGMMKLAAIQAEDLRDLPAATETLHELLRQPALPPQNAVAALQTLADWQLHFGRDPAAARVSFERIIQMFPDSPFSHTAEQRLAHLDGVTEAREFREHAIFKVPAGQRDLGLRKTVLQVESPQAGPDALAAEYVGQLEKYPNDTETRQKLAVLYAEQFDRLDLAVDQLEQLAALPNANPNDIAHWLNLLATLHIRHGNDMASAENALHRIIDRFPKSAAASKAVARLAALEGELRAAAASAATKALGTYEKDLGLKHSSGRPRIGG